MDLANPSAPIDTGAFGFGCGSSAAAVWRISSLDEDIDHAGGKLLLDDSISQPQPTVAHLQGLRR